MNQAPAQSLSSVLRAVASSEDTDLAFILAGTINLYHETLRRRGSRHLLGPEDIIAINSIIEILLAANGMEEELKRLAGRPNGGTRQ